jgi:glycosylphosphatidylinositol transamidase
LLCILAGVVLLLLLPLNNYSRHTYVSENALLPGQVHTYFGGSEHNVFRAYRQEVNALVDKPRDERVQRLREIFASNGLKVATQKYEYPELASNITGENVYAVLQGPRADATEAIVLIGAWRNMDMEINQSGVALVLTLARYFKRWSLWSKDIIFIIPDDSTSGPQAWVDAYHDAHDPRFVAPLTIKSGALQGAVAVDYPAGPWGHRFDKLHIIYDGVNGRLPNLDLFNTAVSVASGQMGISCTLQRAWNHGDSYKERLTTLARGMLNQAIGHATGPHSGFMRYHVDAITLQTVGDGWHDEMGLGRSIEGLFRSLNNLLEHLHQSFFFYLLMSSDRFVSIGTYLPSAMCIAASFSIMAIALWWQSGFGPARVPSTPAWKPDYGESSDKKKTSKNSATQPASQPASQPATEPTPSQPPIERHMFFPLIVLTTIHFLGLIPLSLFNHSSPSSLAYIFQILTIVTLPLPGVLAFLITGLRGRKATEQELTLLHCFCLLLLGMFLAALATVNYSLAYIVGALCSPLILVRIPTVDSISPSPKAAAGKSQTVGGIAHTVLLTLVLWMLSPMTVIWVGSTFVPGGLGEVLRMAEFGWWVWGLWTQVVVWLVWWPAWFAGCFVLASQTL